MTDVLSELISLLSLEKLEENLFRGPSQDLGWGTVFGGQVLGQALSAASQTVPSDRIVHSLHSYFLRPGDVRVPVVYDVERIRDGSSFATRRVVAIQKGRPIFSMSASFQIEEEGYDHQDEMPDDVPGPEGLPSQRELAKSIAHMIPEPMRERATGERPIEQRPVNPQNPLRPKPAPPRRQTWYRTMRTIEESDPSLHRYLLAYASDFNFLGTSAQPHGVAWLSPGMQMASLDHSMWFHRSFRMDEWLLHDMESPSAQGARGLVRGKFYTQDGKLVATTSQEGLIRHHK